MLRFVAAFTLCFSLSGIAAAQSSGPGPDPSTGDAQKQYDAVLYQRNATQKGPMIFSAAADTSSELTTGDFESDIDGNQLTGTWRAYDLGGFAFWYAHASGDTGNLTVFGWATPDFIVGQARMGTSGSSFFSRLFGGKTYFLHGTAAAPIVTEPTEPAPSDEPATAGAAQ